MALMVRIYGNEQQARNVVAELQKKLPLEGQVFFAKPTQGQESAIVRSAVSNGDLPRDKEIALVGALKQGRCIVAASPSYGHGNAANEVFNSGNPIKLEPPKTGGGPVALRDPSPLSDRLGIPTLVKDSRSKTRLSDREPFSDLKPHDYSISSKLRLPMLLDRAAPLSSMFGWPTILSSPKRPWTQSFGIPLQTSSPWVLGEPLLSRNPAPLSSMLGLAVLSD